MGADPFSRKVGCAGCASVRLTPRARGTVSRFNRVVMDTEAVLQKLRRHDRGWEALRAMVSRWMARSSWSYMLMAELAEQAIRDVEAPGVPDFDPNAKKGQLLVANGHVWLVLKDLKGKVLAPVHEAGEGRRGGWNVDEEHFQHVAPVRRVFSSQINNLLRGQTRNVYAVLFDGLGVLNEWIDSIQGGQRPMPESDRLSEGVRNAVVIRDSEGAFGPEEFLSVFLGRMEIPEILSEPSEQEADEISQKLARKVRGAMAAAQLDLVEDWPELVACYPSASPDRLRLLRDVVLGLRPWPASQVRDEEMAVEIAVAKLCAEHGCSAEGDLVKAEART